ncbi:MAG: DUF4417 domain-containing protein [Bacteroides sp.]|nr:DUF4417 domain-containing protein [Bacteroides sp.]
MKLTDIFVPEDRLYPSDNEYEIPSLRIDRQPETGLLLPFAPWGANSRRRSHVGTFHFYVDDYRFNNIWLHPEKLILTGCKEVVEPNFSLFDSTPIAFGLQQLYKKRWIARWFQECGVNVWVDLHVSSKFRDFNRLGVPAGYNAFATRGVSDCPDIILDELEVAKEISGQLHPNLIIYGGGNKVKDICRKHNLLYIEQHMVRMRESREGVDNG